MIILDVCLCFRFTEFVLLHFFYILFRNSLVCVCVCVRAHMLMCLHILSSSLHGWVRTGSSVDVFTDVFLYSVPLRLSLGVSFIPSSVTSTYLCLCL